MTSLLVLGGTSFVGRHIVEVALEGGIDVTLFNRGVTNAQLFPGCERRVGDRRAGDLESLRAGEWDAVVDVNGYLPREVEQSTSLLEGRVGHYLFVSSIGVFAFPASGPIDEDSPTWPAGDPEATEMGADYGPLKVRCEQIVGGRFGDASAVVRPGLVVGPHDPTDRFTYWVRRAGRGGRILVPDQPDQPVQFVHARDQAAFVVRLATSATNGTYNSVGPGEQLTLGGFLAAAATVSGHDLEVVWADAAFLRDGGATYPGPVYPPGPYDSINLVSTERSARAGLAHRAVGETIDDVLRWDRTRDQDVPLGGGQWMDDPLEQRLLAEWSGSRRPSR